MALPVINTTTHKIKLPSGRSLNIRPFTGEEEKALLMAKITNDVESNSFEVIKKIISSCADIDVSTIDIPDLEVLFLKLYEISVDVNITSGVSCPKCDNKMNIKIPIESIKNETSKGYETKIDVGKDAEGNEIVVVLGIPKIGDIEKLSDSSELIKASLTGVYAGIEELEFEDEEFMPWFMSLTNAYPKALKHLLNIPSISVENKMICDKCSYEFDVKMRGLQDFFTS